MSSGAAVSSAMARDLLRLSDGAVVVDANLSQYSRWHIGGRARLLVEAGSAEGVRRCLSWLDGTGVPVVVIGDGSNILFDDAGIDGVVIRIGRGMAAFAIRGRTATAQAGVWVPQFTRALGRAGLAGAQHAIGIPGTLGGLVVMNGGSQRKGIGDSLTMVRGCDMSGRPFEVTHDECAFRYRGSILQDRRAVVLEAEFAFSPAEPAALRREMIAIMRSRRARFPKDLPNCGSVFLSDPAMYQAVGPPGRTIEEAGLKGRSSGQAQISPRHANFIVNRGGARSADVLRLIQLIRSTVHERTGFLMSCEVRHVGPDGRVRPAHEAAERAVTCSFS